MRIFSRWLQRSRGLVLLGLILVAAVVGGLAWAAIPANGVYTGCYMKSGGTLRVIDASQNCKSSETRITRNQQGIPGQQGQPGSPGGAVMEHRSWCGGEGCPQARWFTNADVDTNQHLILTVPRPNDGSPPWDQTIAMASMKWWNNGDVAVEVDCLVGQDTLFTTVPVGQHVELSGTTPYHVGSGSGSGNSTAEVSCRFSAYQQGTVSLQLMGATLTLVPASYMHTQY